MDDFYVGCVLFIRRKFFIRLIFEGLYDGNEVDMFGVGDIMEG